MSLSVHQAHEPVQPGNRTVARLIGIITIVLLASGSVFGQFIVNPMKLNVPVQPRRRVPVSVTITNTLLDESQAIDLRIVDVTQDADGVWEIIEVDDPNADASQLRSCRSWLTLERETVNLPPAQRAPVQMWVTVPAGRRGYFCAAILAAMRPRLAEYEGVTASMTLQFLIPVIVEVQGRPLPHDVSLKDAGLLFRRQTERAPAASLVNMVIENAGGTFSRLEGMARISVKWGGHWRRITEVKVPAEGDIGIIPNVTLNLKEDVGRPLPSGTYRIEGFLVVDGKRSDQIVREVEFKGDPRMITVAGSDAALDLDPRELSIDVIPGAMRTKTISVINASEETVLVNVRTALPAHMIATALPQNEQGRTMRGEEFGCTDWLTVSPEQFTLNGYGRQSLRITCQTPATEVSLPSYYSLVELLAKYPDGQPAGKTKGLVYVENREAEGAPRVDGVQLTFPEVAASRYLITARFGNFGNTHVMPRCRAVLTSVQGGALQKQIQLSSEAYDQSGNMLPLEYRTFSGVLDVSTLTPGDYRLTAILEYDQGGNAQRQAAFRVADEGGTKSVQQVGLEDVGGPTIIRL